MPLDDDVQTNTISPATAPAATNRATRREQPNSWIQGFAIFALAYATYWIGWRWTHTINTDPKAIIPSLLLLFAETWA
jgi:type VI protein secretion system component VasF